jgi:NAD(P)-dependent dehydrogenase (short-subunit alcohol dehydrogenase family)
MPGRLTDKVAIVTGAGSVDDGVSIGRAIAVLFAREGARVWLVDREEERAEHTRAAIEAEGGTARTAVGDVTRSEDCARFVADAVAEHGRLDLLVNNVGIVPPSAQLHESDEAVWDRVIESNLKSAMLMSKHAIPRLAEAGGGAIVNISSIGGMRSSGGYAYGPSKAAMLALTRDVAVSYGPQGIRANAIAPGHIYTPIVAGTMSPENRERRRKVAPLGIEGEAWDIGWAAVYLASDEARFVSGICLPVDAGVTATMPLTGAGLIDR